MIVQDVAAAESLLDFFWGLTWSSPSSPPSSSSGPPPTLPSQSGNAGVGGGRWPSPPPPPSSSHPDAFLHIRATGVTPRDLATLFSTCKKKMNEKQEPIHWTSTPACTIRTECPTGLLNVQA